MCVITANVLILVLVSFNKQHFMRSEILWWLALMIILGRTGCTTDKFHAFNLKMWIYLIEAFLTLTHTKCTIPFGPCRPLTPSLFPPPPPPHLRKSLDFFFFPKIFTLKYLYPFYFVLNSTIMGDLTQFYVRYL